jgi:hypothetical protein
VTTRGRPVRTAAALAFAACLSAPGIAAAGPLTPTMTMQIRLSTGTVVTATTAGAKIHPYVQLTGNGGVVTGKVAIDAFNDGSCAKKVDSGLFLLSGGAVDATALTEQPLDPGSFSFRASYSGDGTYSALTGPCTVVTISKAKSTVTAVIRNSNGATITSVPFSGRWFLTITASGPAGTPTGSVQLSIFAGLNCTGTLISQSIGPFDSPGVLTIDSLSLVLGSYSFRAEYLGSSRYLTSSSACVPLTVVRGANALDASLRDAANSVVTQPVAGSPIHHHWLVTNFALGANTWVGGQVAFAVYAGTSCSGTALQQGTSFLQPTAVSTQSTADSFVFVPPAAGVYAFHGGFSDPNWTGLINCIVLTVGAAPTPSPTATPSLSPSQPAPTSTPHASSSPTPTPLPSPTPGASGVPPASSGPTATGPAGSAAPGSTADASTSSPAGSSGSGEPPASTDATATGGATASGGPAEAGEPTGSDGPSTDPTGPVTAADDPGFAPLLLAAAIGLLLLGAALTVRRARPPGPGA